MSGRVGRRLVVPKGSLRHSRWRSNSSRQYDVASMWLLKFDFLHTDIGSLFSDLSIFFFVSLWLCRALYFTFTFCYPVSELSNILFIFCFSRIRF